MNIIPKVITGKTNSIVDLFGGLTLGSIGWYALSVTLLLLSSMAVMEQPVHEASTNDGVSLSADAGGNPITGPVPPQALNAVFEGHFLENLGQAPRSDVAFYAVGEPLSVGFGEGFFEYALGDGDGEGGSVVRVHLGGADAAEPAGAGALDHPTSFLLGRDPSGWGMGVRSFRQVVYHEAWPGIDLSFELCEDRLKYELLVRPGADVAGIRLVYEGAAGLEVDTGTGALIVRTAAGDIRDEAPWSYQVVDGVRRTVATRYRVDGGDTVAFDVAPYRQDLPLVIDPALTLSTYLGGSSSDYLWDMTVDSGGSIYVTGCTASTSYPVTSGAYCRTLDGSKDIFVSKLKSDGSGLVYSTFLGGSGQDEARGIAVDGSGSAFIAGSTSSSDYPVTSGANQTTRGGSMDMVVTKLNANGTGIRWSTYVGGSQDDLAFDIRVDSSGAVYVGGYTNGSFPTTSGAFDTSHNSKYDGVVLKLSSNGTRLVYSTYLGGDKDDYVYGIAVDSSGNAYATGMTASSSGSFPVTDDAFETDDAVGDDGFLLHLNASGTGLYWCGMVSGDTSGTGCRCVDVDEWGTAYVAGETTSDGFPISNWSYDDDLDGASDAFVACIGHNNTYSYYSYFTYLGGGSSERVLGIHVDSDGDVHLTGWTNSSDYPTTPGAYDTSYNNRTDIFYTELEEYGQDILYSTYVGTGGDEEGRGVHVSSGGTVTVAGITASAAFPTTAGAYCTTRPGGTDGVILQLGPTAAERPWFGSDATPTNASVGEHLTFSIQIYDDTGVWNASVEYWYGDGTHDSYSLWREAGTDKAGTWEDNFYPRGTLDPLHYIFYATDEDGNSNNTTVRTIRLYDGEAPWIDDHTPWYNWPDGPTTGDPFRFVANVSDGMGVSEVRVHYTIGTPAWLDVNVTMEPWYVYYNGIGTYVLNATAPSNTTGPIHYFMMATDFSDNTRVIEVLLNITDNDGPELGPDTSDTGATTGDVLRFSVAVGDNAGVAGVWVNYRYAGKAVQNRSMGARSVDASGNGVYEYNLTTLTDYAGPITYWFLAADVGWNWNVTSDVMLVSVDDDPPEMGADHSHEGVDELVLEVEAFDNVGIARVWVVYTYKGQAPVNVTMVPLVVEANGNGSYGHVELPVTPEQQVRIDYVFGAMDAAGHMVTLAGRYMNIDPDPPEFGEHGVLGEPVKGWDVSIWVRVWDNLQLEDVRLVYSFGGGPEVNVSMADEGDRFNFTVPLPRSPAGDLLYRFEAVDVKGNWNRTVDNALALENRAPQAATPITWELVEGETGVLDLAPLLSDDNDAKGRLSLATEAEGVTVDGLRLSGLYDEWRADHDIAVTVSDGETATIFTIAVHVLGVNDPPVIKSTPPLDCPAGEVYSYQVEYADEDVDDILTLELVEFPEGMAIDANGLVTWTPSPGQEGAHPVKLTLSDGSSPVHQTWAITVTPPLDKPPAFTNSPPLAHAAGAHYEWDAGAEDPDGETVGFSLVSGPAGATMDPVSGVLGWDPPADRRDAIENRTFVVRVTAGELHTDLDFTVTLTYPVDRAPEIAPGLKDMKVSKESRLDLTEYMSDPDDPREDLHWTAVNNTDLFTVRMDGSVLVIEPKVGKEGVGTVTLSLHDPWGRVDTHELSVQVDKEGESGSQAGLAALWWVLAIVLMLALHVLILTRKRWMPRERAP